MKASENEFPKVIFAEGTAPATPSTGTLVLYAKSSDSKLYIKDDAGTETDITTSASGSVATDAIWDAKGDLAVGTGANTAQKLTVGANGTRPEAASGETTGVKWSYPPGYEFDYVSGSGASITATSEGTANTVVTANAVTYDGSTTIIVEFFCPAARPDTGAAARAMTFVLFDGSSAIGQIGYLTTPAASSANSVVHAVVRLTPSNASHTYSVRAWVSAGTGSVSGSTGGAGTNYPLFIRQTKV